MKKHCLALLSLGLSLTALAAPSAPVTPAVAWDSIYPAVEAQIKAPVFPDKDYRLLDYGKKSKTPGLLYTEMINNLIDRSSSQ